MTNKKTYSGNCRTCGYYFKDLWKHLNTNPKHKTPNPKDKSNYKSYHRGKNYREAKANFYKNRYRRKHPKKMKLKDFF